VCVCVCDTSNEHVRERREEEKLGLENETRWNLMTGRGGSWREGVHVYEESDGGGTIAALVEMGENTSHCVVLSASTRTLGSPYRIVHGAWLLQLCCNTGYPKSCCCVVSLRFIITTRYHVPTAMEFKATLARHVC
jgi:hypothetical protein